MSTGFTSRKKQQSEDLSQLMPQNIDAEEAILGAILVSPTCMNKVAEQYTAVDGGSIITPKGFRAGGIHCGLKKTDRHDLGAIVCDVRAVAAAVYTTNVFQAAPLKVTRESAADGHLQAIVVNSG